MRLGPHDAADVPLVAVRSRPAPHLFRVTRRVRGAYRDPAALGKSLTFFPHTKRHTRLKCGSFARKRARTLLSEPALRVSGGARHKSH